jgi:hypothetical protein
MIISPLLRFSMRTESAKRVLWTLAVILREAPRETVFPLETMAPTEESSAETGGLLALSPA